MWDAKAPCFHTVVQADKGETGMEILRTTMSQDRRREREIEREDPTFTEKCTGSDITSLHESRSPTDTT
jgi:hypothetical protein